MNVLRRQPDFRQFVERQTDQRRAQHRDARNVLQRIVEQLQQAQQIQDFRALEKSAALDHQRHAGPLEFLRVSLRLVRAANAAAPPCRAIRPDGKPFAPSSQISCRASFNSFNRSASNRASFSVSSRSGQIVRAGFAFRIRLAAPAFFEMQKQFGPRRRISGQAEAPRAFPANRIAIALRRHNATPPTSSRMSSSKTEFTKCKQAFAAAEIFRQRNRLPVFAAPGCGVIAEDFRVGEPETVDALFHVADEEAVARWSSAVRRLPGRRRRDCQPSRGSMPG